jgi:RPA family protein
MTTVSAIQIITVLASTLNRVFIYGTLSPVTVDTTV